MAYPRELEADLARFYGEDLRELWRGGLSLRRLGVLVDGLPPESLLASRLDAELPTEARESSGVERRWSVEAQLLAAVVDTVADVGWTLRQVNSKQRVPRPKPLDRPGQRRRVRRLTPEERRLAFAIYERSDDGN